jgi:hypothetical protein
MALGLRTAGMEFASEMVVRASIGGLRIREVPTTLRPDGRTRSPHLRTWRDGWRHLKFILAFSPRWLFLYPAYVLQLVGLGGLIWLTPGPRQIGGVGFDLHSMLAFATMLILGVQAAGLAILTRSYAAHLELLPRSPRLERLIERLSLERGILVGLLLVLAGVGSFFAALTTWGQEGFGALQVVDTLRVPIIGMVLIITGFQLITVSFTLSLTRVGED